MSVRYFQPDDSHCPSREYLETAPWSAVYTVHVTPGFDADDLVALRPALHGSSGTVIGSAGASTAAWSTDVSSGAVPSSTDETPAAEARRLDLARAGAALPGVSWSSVSSATTTVLARDSAAVPGVVSWLREQPNAGSKSAGVGTKKKTRLSIGVSDGYGVSDRTVHAAVQFFDDHRGISSMIVSRSTVLAVLPTERAARAFVSTFERTPADLDEQDVRAWWPDDDGHEVHGMVGANL
ncbi:hypothetical protein [Curtobacterium sp. MCSS17_016]|uniref:hypothetical protein n=1 Tax=Curtobacterium sp. MCSS17_016 TaxID=2175644 RepID=UPI0011B39DAB|nr:hypothetical protein [Curtobacterium sp. MCSS17_016]WIE81475.1 hypothetical protein DEJ19_019760 [Curtobacterium sp. MCSS17_016]